jgi:TetR/AcrR family transcriptional regulator, acrAB operon repressor
MPRKTPEESALTRSAILDAALEVFAEKGYSHSTLNDIARKAGFTRGAVYWHFSDKNDLFIALADDIEKSANNLFQKAEPASAEDLQKLFCDYFSLFDNDERYCKFYEVIWFYAEWSENLSPVLAKFRQEMRQMSDWLIVIFTQFHDKGQLTSVSSPKMAATASRAMLEGLTSLRLSDPQHFPSRQELNEILHHFFSAYITG